MTNLELVCQGHTARFESCRAHLRNDRRRGEMDDRVVRVFDDLGLMAGDVKFPKLMWEKASVYKVVQWSDDTHPWIGRFLPQRRSDIRVQTAFRRQYLPAWMRCSLDRTHRCPSWPCPWRPGVRQRHEQSPRRLPHAWLPLEDACFGERANDSYRCSGNCPDAAKGSDQQELIPHRGLNIVWNLALHPPLRLGGATRAPVPSSCCRVPPGRHTERHRHAG